MIYRIPSWELRYPLPKRHCWVDDFPNFPRSDMYPLPGGTFSMDFFHIGFSTTRPSMSVLWTWTLSPQMSSLYFCTKCWVSSEGIVKDSWMSFSPRFSELFGHVRHPECSPRIFKKFGFRPRRGDFMWFSISISLPEYWRRSPKQEFQTTIICVSPIFHQPPIWPVNLCWGDGVHAVVPARSRQDPRLEG